MTDPRWMQILDAGRIEGLSDEARRELLEIAQQDPECAQRLEAEGWLDAAFDGGSAIKPSRALQQALLDVPRRDRRWRVLAPLMLPLAMCICSFGSVYLYQLAPGLGGGLTARDERATTEALGMAPGGDADARKVEPESATGPGAPEPGLAATTAAEGSDGATASSGGAETRTARAVASGEAVAQATLGPRLPLVGTSTPPPASAPERGTQLALLPETTPTWAPGGGESKVPPSRPTPGTPGPPLPPTPSATSDDSAGSGPAPSSPTPTLDSNKVIAPTVSPTPTPPMEARQPSPTAETPEPLPPSVTETPLPTPELAPSATPTDNGRDDPVTPVPTGSPPTVRPPPEPTGAPGLPGTTTPMPSVTATSTITPTMTLTPTPGLGQGLGLGMSGAGTSERGVGGAVSLDFGDDCAGRWRRDDGLGRRRASALPVGLAPQRPLHVLSRLPQSNPGKPAPSI